MGYTTEFSGELKFTKEPSVPMIAALNEFFGQDTKVLGITDRKLGGYVQLELTKDMTGIRWDGTEKCYNMHHTVTALVVKMREKFPDFGLTGEMLAQGEDVDDRWILKMVGDVATVEKIQPTGTRVKCPECDHEFRVG